MASDLPGLVQQIAHFESRLQADPASRVFLPLADLYRRAGRLEEARRILLSGLENHPDFLTARVALGLVLTELGEMQPARQHLQGVLASDPDNLLALRLLGRDAAERSDWDEACALNERLLRLEPEDGAVREALREARLRLEDGPRRAVDPTAPPAPALATGSDAGAAGGFETPTLAQLYIRQGHPEKARLILERILAAEPDRQDARTLMAKLEAEAAPPQPAPAMEAQGPDETSTGPSATMSGGEDLDRFRAWLDATADARQSES
jgi:tetratricopeptide (TPR) repeat protein